MKDIFEPKGFDLKPEKIIEMAKKGKRALPLFAGVVIFLVLILAFFQGIYQVNVDEEAVVFRFGRYNRIAAPGLHFMIPFGVENRIVLPVKRVLKTEFGFRTRRPGVRSVYEARGYEDEKTMLTGDLNIAEVEWTVQYRISDPKAYIFNLRTPEKTIRDISESVTRRVVGNNAIDAIMTAGRETISVEVLEEIQSVMNLYHAGVTITNVQLQNIFPPESVRPAYDDVNKAIQDREKLENEALARYNQEIPKAEGEALQIIQEAEGYKLERVNRAKGDVARFEAILKEYRKAPEVTRKRLFIESMTDILPRVKDIWIVDEDQKSILPLLNLPVAPGEEKKP